MTPDARHRSRAKPRRFDPTRSAPLLGAVVESAPTAILMIDVEGRIVLVNREMEKLFGYERNEILGEPVQMLIPERLLKGAAGERRADFELRQARRIGTNGGLFGMGKDGREIPVEIGLNPIETEEGAFALVAVMDIGERQRLEQEQRLLSSVVENVEDYAIITLDLEGRVTTWNAGAERIEGYRAEDIIGRHCAVFHVPEDVAAGRPEAELAAARAAGRHAEEGWRVRADGSHFWALVTVSTMRDASGELIGYSKITRDLTEHRLAEQRFRATIESAPTAMVMIDETGRIALLNAGTENLFGYGRNELLNQPVEVLLPERFRAGHPQLRDAYFAEPLARPMGAGRDLFGRRKDGSEFPIEIGLNPVEMDQGLFVLSAVVDITERKRLEDAQRKLNQELEARVEQRTAELEVARDAAQAASRAKSEFLANMSHEIRTPLNAVIGLTEAVLRTTLTDAQRDHLSTVMDSSEVLLNVINDVLDFSKIEVGKLTLERVPFDLHELVSDTLRAQAIRAFEKGIAVCSYIDPRLPVERIGDPGRLRQVITNLVGNAIKFTNQGEVVVRVESANDGHRLNFSVQDTGVGIDPDQLDRLFEPFEQSDSSTTRRHGGTGLGLSISRQLVDLMGGEIGATSSPGRGSNFLFSVDIESRPDSAAERARHILEGRRVLVVDPHAMSREIHLEILAGYGVDARSAASADEATQQLLDAHAEGKSIDAVVFDTDLEDAAEGADRGEFVRRVRETPQLADVKVVLLARADANAAPAQARLADLTVTKPIHQTEWFDAIRACIASDARAAKTAARAPEESEEAGAAEQGPQRILVVEDSIANQKVVRAILGRDGHALEFAGNGREALERLAHADFDLVLMDVQMPEMDGLEATAAIRAGEVETGRHIRIVAMTAHAMAGDREKCLAAGMDDYVSKPVRRADLVAALGRSKGQPAASETTV